MNHYGKVLVATGFLLLTACQSTTQPDTAAVPPGKEADSCGASRYQNFVGKPLSALEQQRFSQKVRAIPWNSAVTMDFNFARLNFLADKSGTITQVYCG
ncbi:MULTISPECIES: I78 family peptidase inhibitor [Pantoea]|uniref:Peptidase inhibitor I78 family protein n=1 Tax=Pantoea stewartii subsp. stewartii DC283 TaxID=660596 RepID=H3R9U5_PANSE|nr:I78 family peptidase inhibitor [Pantoea stewartii]ARF51400.1 hypothetical protein DSJ_20150 [Pantoea stewartii subsp. stewartii DC283]EHU01958.1 hypothetical protein CKS_0427 [Pantoea stewartii subsp. stewartii DC283]MEB6535116.1 I78 family peptidase inhibitor [Pantoea stewartii]